VLVFGKRHSPMLSLLIYEFCLPRLPIVTALGDALGGTFQARSTDNASEF